MGIRNPFRPPKEASHEQAEQYLKQKGVEVYDEKPSNRFNAYNVKPMQRVRRKPQESHLTETGEASAPVNSERPGGRINDPFSEYALTHPEIDSDLNSYDPDNLNMYEPADLQEEDGMTEAEREIARIEKRIREVRLGTLQSSENTRQHLESALETGINTTGLLASQGERLYTTRNRADVLQQQQIAAEESIDDLRWNDRSIFSAKVRAPVKSREAKDFVDLKTQALLRRKGDRAVRDAKFQKGQTEMETLINRVKVDTKEPELGSDEDDLNESPMDRKQRLDAVQNMMLKYKDDNGSDEEIELKLSKNLDRTYVLAKNLNELSKGMNSELQRQNEYISDLGSKMDQSSVAILKNNKDLNDAWLQKKKKKNQLPAKSRGFEKFDDDDDDIEDYEDKLDRFLGDNNYDEDNDFSVKRVIKKML
ncbi:unnamed protein product [Kuraishia capsulata CBS 1993]|uniref:t-SNARE coiled-coil homology domain-containing protein n=1 Tax=Kuraishia capsulata CBS 1993 TaxID=1382522 RepID=W6MPZ6_9ASCO|nr:uncharacterized protein KUCA_T00004385001 [Kuraishia capsulata CBS 1993]CDK28403.1 unnamed protein product [Kuraishia capsulata CBS 1993]